MRKIIVLSFITLDGVMQAPGGPEEDISGGFKYGGWVAPYGDEVFGKVMEKQMKPADLFWAEKHLRFGRTTGRNMPRDGRVSMMLQNMSCPGPGKSRIGKTQFSSKAWQISKSSKIQKVPKSRFTAVVSSFNCSLRMIWWTNSGSKFTR